MHTLIVAEAAPEGGRPQRLRAAANEDAAWRASPCFSCMTSPCCTHVPLYRFRAETKQDIEYARRLLRHEMFEIGIYDSGWWMVYYLAPCRFLNLSNSKCLIHGTPHQPKVCRDYSPIRCWYKRVFTTTDSPDFIRLDQRRIERLARLVRFDNEDRLADVPEWEALLRELAPIPPADGARPGKIEPQGISPVPSPAGIIGSMHTTQFLFPLRTPTRAEDLDLLRFRLGFPGVAVGRSRGGWLLVISAVLQEAAPAGAGAADDPAELYCFDSLVAPPAVSPEQAKLPAVLHDLEGFDRLAAELSPGILP